MQENWATRMIALFGTEQPESTILFAKLVSNSPLSISINNQVIDRFVYKLESAKGLLNNDSLIVVRQQNEFYILGKVER
ncbi:MAG: hypothetical protein Q4A72_05520 [Bacillota bacterium]|nr:hypothetical protein [Bacillota bacterium]